MAKVQTRRTVSMNGNVYKRLKAHCEKRGLPMSQLVEFLINEEMDRFDAEDVDEKGAA